MLRTLLALVFCRRGKHKWEPVNFYDTKQGKWVWRHQCTRCRRQRVIV